MNPPSGSTPDPTEMVDSLVPRVVLQAWRDVLGIQRISLDDDFFRLGGTSLDAIRIIARLEEDLDVELSVRVVLEARTLGRMLDLLHDLVREGG